MSLNVSPDKETLSRRAAEAVAALIRHAVDQRGRCTIAMAGGSTPHRLYEILATDIRDDIPWERVHLIWGDERHVPLDHPKSNFRMAREALLERVPLLPDHIYPTPITGDPAADAAAYAATIDTLLVPDSGRLDLVLLGLGDDGHTASLFPGSPALAETTRTVVAAPAPVDPRQRITLTFPAINRARNVFFLVASADKAPALACVFGKPGGVAECPASRVQPAGGELVWWMDEAAAACLEL
ncbi:MAG: 6-phosphogluconolactonase [Rhodothermales bacterium]|nr:6-phosphogluconolactonase [Rhodothermales bacterium]